MYGGVTVRAGEACIGFSCLSSPSRSASRVLGIIVTVSDTDVSVAFVVLVTGGEWSSLSDE